MKRVLSLVLTLLLLVSLIPAGAVEFSLTANAEEYTYGYYTYTVENGEATITAVDNINMIGSITVPSTLGGYPVRTIGRAAFIRAAYITSLTLPSSLRTVEEYAFEYCYSMESVTFQYGVTSIGLGAFYQCEALTTVNLPESVQTIGDAAFQLCESLTTITFPDSITYMGRDLFVMSGVLENAENYDEDGAFYSGKHLIDAESVTGDYVIHEGTKTIAGNAFNRSNVTAITVPNSVVMIGDYAFSECSSLTSLTIGNGVQTVSAYAFDAASPLETVTVAAGNPVIHSAGNCLIHTASRQLWLGTKNSVIPTDGTVTSIAKYAFWGSDVAAITIPAAVKTIGEYAFYDCTALTSVTLENGVESIGEQAFLGCTALESMHFPASVTSIAGNVMRDCDALSTITVASENTVYSGAGNCLIEKASRTLIAGTNVSVIPADGSVTSIGKEAFYNCDALESIAIPAGVTSIGEHAFYSCSALTTVTIADSVDTIERCAFLDCAALTTLSFGNGVQQIGDSAFGRCIALTALVIPDSVKTIGYAAFNDCTALTKVTVGTGVETMGNRAFAGCTALAAVEYNAANCATAGNYSSPVFSNCTVLKTMTIGEDVQTIPQDLLSGCTVLATLNYNAKDCKQIGNSYYNPTVFSSCTKLQTITIGKNVQTIPPRAFGDCKALITVKFNATNCTAMATTGERAFAGCTKLKKVVVGNAVKTIPDSAFRDCTKLATLTLGNSVQSIDNGAFYGCTALTAVTLPSSLQNIGDSAFQGCEVFTELTVPSSVQSIGKYAFHGCSSLNSLTIEEGVTNIGDSAFSYCLALTEATLPDSVQTMGTGVFEYDNALTQVALPSGITSIPACTFGGCTSLSNVSIPNGVTSIGDSAFSNCSGLANVYYGGSRITRADITIGDYNTYLTDATWHYAEAGCNHPNTTVKNAKDATCTEDGYTGDTVCNDCGETVQTGEIVPTAGAHQWDDGVVTVEPTFNSTGEMTFACTVCGETKREELPQLETCPHANTAIKNVKDVTCTEDGYTGDTVCNDCGETVQAGEIVPTAGVHQWDNGVVTIEPSFDHAGEMTFTCTACGTSYTEEIPQLEGCAHANTAVENAKDATCTEDGYTGDTVCADCGELLKNGDTVAATGVHTFADDADVSCDVCGELRYITYYVAGNAVTILSAETTVSGAVVLPETIKGVPVTAIREGAFKNCTAMTSITIPSNVTYIGADAFDGCTGLTKVNITDLSAWCHITFATAASNPLYNAKKLYLNGEELKQLVIPADVDEVKEYAFTYCTSLTSVTVPSSVKYIGAWAFRSNSAMTSLTLSEGLAGIGSRAFDYCIKLTELNLPQGLTIIGDRAFMQGSNLTSVALPRSVKTIGELAFNKCTKLTTVIYGGDETDRAAITVGTSNDPLTDATWQYTTCLHSNTIYADKAATCTEDGYVNGQVCADCGDLLAADEVISAAGEHVFTDEADIVCDQCGDVRYLTYYVVNDRATILSADTAISGAVEIPDSIAGAAVVAIGNEAFKDCTAMTSVSIPSTVSYIGSGAFDGCTGLTKVSITDLSAWCRITFADTTANPLYNARKLYLNGEAVKDLVIPADVFEIKDYAFTYCTSVASITVPSHVKRIGAYAFRSGTRLTSLTFEEGVESIGSYAFNYCLYITTLTLPKSLVTIEDHAFMQVAMTTVTLPRSVKTIGAYAFNKCNKLTDVYYGGTEEDFAGITIGDNNAPLTDATWYYTTCTHENTQTVNGVDATCTENGYSGDTVCADCGETMATGEVVPALGHSEVVDEAVLPTCTATGLTAGAHCGVCGAVLTAQEIVPALGHSEVVDEAVEPTCTATGLTAGTHCGVCGAVLTAQEIVPALGHSEVIDEAVLPTCTATGLTAGVHCDVCGAVLTAQEIVPALGHSEVIDEAVLPTCTATGLTAGVHCGVCGAVLTAQETVPALGHSEVVDEAVEPTCTATGLTAGAHCGVCGEVLTAQEVVPVVDHTYTDANDSVCDVCGTDNNEDAFTYTVENGKATITKVRTTVRGEVVVPAMLDGYVVTAIAKDAFRNCVDMTAVTIPATITSIGQYAFKDCTALTKVYYYAANCTSAGVNAYPVFHGCTALTTVYIGKTVESVPPRLFRQATAITTVYLTRNTKVINQHAFYLCDNITDVYFVGTAGDFTNITINSYNTALSNATISYNTPCFDEHEWTAACDAMCDLCATKRVTTHANIVEDAEVPPTCDETGLTAGSHCAVCGNIVVPQTVIAALGHVWDDGVVLEAPSNGMPGKKMYTCTTCGATKTVELTNATIVDGYYYVDGVLTKNAGLVKVEDAYYFITATGAVKKGRHSVTNTNGLAVEKGIYHFFNSGKMNQERGVYAGYYYNDSGKSEPYAGLIEWNGAKYYIGGNGGMVTKGRYFITKLNGLVPKKRAYTFFDDGRMLEDNRVHTDGFYYENGIRVPYAGLIEYDNAYYYIADNGAYVTGRKFISNMNNTGKVKGYYYFDADGKMLTGKRVVYGYYYEDGYAPSYVGLVKVNAYYYYVQLNGAVVKNKERFNVSKTNGLVEKGYYAFDENGRMVL